MGSIAGYKCALIAADTLGKYVPMLTTAAGTTKAANVLVFGVAVAGLQAIAIMNRLGAEVFAYDIRPETKEQAQSLGATFIDSDDEREEEEEEDEFVEYEPKGFNKLMTSLGFYSFAEPPRDEYIVEGEEEPEEDEEEDEGWSKEKLERGPEAHAREDKGDGHRHDHGARARQEGADAGGQGDGREHEAGVGYRGPGRRGGGNCELTEAGETVEHQNVSIMGPVNLPSRMPIHASQLLSRNMHNLIGHITEDRADEENEHDLHPNLDFEDEIIDTMCIAHDGEIRHDNTREALESASGQRERGRLMDAGTPGAARHLDHRGVPGVRADLARAEPAAHAAHERDERHPRGRPGGGHDHARHRERHLHHSGGLYSRGLRGDERGRRLLGDEPDARHVPSTAPKGKEEKKG